MENFKALGLPEALNHTLEHMKFSVPTPIQAQAIPPAMQGRDILGSAQTGTGKTGAFGIPLANYLMTNEHGTALVMTPTRELALQVLTQLQTMMGRRSGIKTALLIGGDSMNKQLGQLKQRPRLYVGTPGRINDHLMRGTLKLNDTRFLVLDETDRMLDMGFTIQIEKILKHIPKERQTLLFSATLPHDIVSIASRYMNDPVRVAVDGDSTPAKNIKQEVVHTTDGEKYGLFVNQLTERKGTVIVFVKTKYGTEKMAVKLAKEGHSVAAIHGDLRQSKRDRVIAEFRNYKHRILVATDVASRGLDIPHIEHVINYDLPQCAEDYIHRIGRTARAGAEGSALCFVTPADRAKWRAIQRLLDPEAAAAEGPRYERSGSNRQPQQRRHSGGGDRQRSPRPERFDRKEANSMVTKQRSQDEWLFQEPKAEQAAKPQRAEWKDKPQRAENGAPRSDFKAKPKRSESNRYPESRNADRKPRTENREPRAEWKDKPQRAENSAPRSDYQARPARAEWKDKPQRSENGGQRSDYQARPARAEWKDKPQRSESSAPRSDYQARPARSENGGQRSEYKGKGQFEGKRRFEGQRSEGNRPEGRPFVKREDRPQLTEKEHRPFKAKPNADRQVPRSAEGNRAPKRQGHNKPYGSKPAGKLNTEKKFFSKKGPRRDAA